MYYYLLSDYLIMAILYHPVCLTGDCDPSYYCVNGSSSATPIDGATGDICPAGFYCPGDTTMPIPCADGKNYAYIN